MDKVLLLLTTEPPVSEPPTFTTCPSNVTILYLLFTLVLILLAVSILSAIMILPRTLSIIFLYFSS